MIRERDHSFWLILTAMAVIVSLFRFAIARYSLWFDEQASMFFAGQPMHTLWSEWMVREPNPPLYYALLKGWVSLFGDSERAVRALSIAAGAGSIVTSAIFTRQVYGRRAGIIAAALTALSTQQLYYSLQARGYEFVYLAASCVLISLVSIERAWRLRRAWSRSLPAYAIGCIVCIYLHTTMFLLPVICSIAIVLVRRRDLAEKPILLLALLAADLAIAVAAGWWLGMTMRQMGAGAENNAVFDAVTPWLVIRKTIGVLSFAKESGIARTAISLVVTAIILHGLRRRWRMPETRLLAVVLGLGIAALALISVNMPIFLPRTIFWLSAIATAFCAGGLAAIERESRRWLAIGGLCLAVAVNMATSVAGRRTEDWDGAIQGAERIPGSRLIVQSEAMGLLLTTACARLHHGGCRVPIIAVITPDDQLDRWSSGLYSGQTVAIDHIGLLPNGRYFVFRKQFYHDLLETLHRHGRARSIRDDPELVGPVDKSALID